MLPPGVTYHNSWMDPEAMRCYQIMEAADSDVLNEWIARWDDFVDFEVVPIVSSADFWANLAR